MTTELPSLPKVGEVVEGKYEILRRIGRGGMAIVYEARSLTLHRSVALKFLQPEMAENERLVERFQREARTAAAITHPCVTYVFDVGWSAEHLPYMAMELLDGHSLAAELRTSGALSVQRVVHIGARVLDALEAAHRLGVVHRDLKPENIFLARQGTQENIKVLDFGISKILGDSRDTLTKTGAVLGTPAYMSPEQVKNARDVDHRSDLYALGTVLYELLAGQPAYAGESFTEVVFKIIAEQPPPLASLRPGLDPALVGVIERAMHKDPSRRWQTAETMRSALSTLTTEPPAGEVKPTPLAWELPSIEDLSGDARRPAPRAESATVAATPSRATTDPRRVSLDEEAPETRLLIDLPAAAAPVAPQVPPSSRRALLIGVPLVAAVGALTAGLLLWLRVPTPPPAPPMLTATPTLPAVTTTNASPSPGIASPLPLPFAAPPAPSLPALTPPSVVAPAAPAPACRLRLVVNPDRATIRLGGATYTGTVDLPAACGSSQSAHVEAEGYESADLSVEASEAQARELTLQPTAAPAPQRPASRPTPRALFPRGTVREGVHLESNPF